MNNAHLSYLGFTAKDKVTGFEGVITSISFDLYGCIQAIVTPRNHKKGQGRWFDVARLEIFEDAGRVLEPPIFADGPFADRVREAAYGCEDKPVKG